MKKGLIIILLLVIVFMRAYAQESFYTQKLKDPKAEYFEAPGYETYPLGDKDNSGALQKAIDAVEGKGRGGVVYIPEGIYRLEKTVNIWKGIRLIGYGKTRPS